MIPTGMRYTATVSGSIWKAVSCEFCRLDYAYKMMRKTTGTGRSVMFLDNQGAQARARSEAYSNLQRSLEKDFDSVPCPKCGRYQQNMFSKVRWKQKGGFTIAGIVGYVVASIAGAVASNPIVFLAGAGVATALLVFGEIRRARFDPNGDCDLRAGKRTAENVVRRTDYEAAIEAAVQGGVDPRTLSRIEWRRAA